MIVVAVAALLAAIAVPGYTGYVDRARVTSATGDMGQIQLALAKFQLNNGQLPLTLAAVDKDTLRDPWGNPYVYLNIEAGANLGAVRKDRNLVPINTDYDLYSKGKDGGSMTPLTAVASRDDVVRANNGGYIGLAENY
jgi:general secretion pathway protein G